MATCLLCTTLHDRAHQCPELSIDNGEVTIVSPDWSINSKATYVCLGDILSGETVNNSAKKMEHGVVVPQSVLSCVSPETPTWLPAMPCFTKGSVLAINSIV